MLPQAALAPWVRRLPVRTWVWVAGAAGQAVSTAGMAFAAATLDGATAGGTVLVALAVFSLARALSSIAAKDVLGRTVPAGSRGAVNGLATTLSGGVAITVGLTISALGGQDVATGPLAALLGAAAAAWVVAGAVYATVTEPAGERATAAAGRWWRRSWNLLRDDVPFRTFVVVRALLLVSALSPPFIVSLAAREGGVGLGALGSFLTASGLAAVLGGRLFGSLADRSSRRLMGWGAAASSGVVLGLLVLMPLPGAGRWLYPLAYLLLAFLHVGVRVARKTYVVDMASGDRRTEYVAVSNTAIGVLLLVTGAVSGALGQLATEVALTFLAVLGLVGATLARRLPEVAEPEA